MFLFSSADFLQNLVFTNKSPRTIIGEPNSLDPDQDGHSVRLYLGSNCLQTTKFSAGMQRVITGKYFSVHILSHIGSFQLGYMYSINTRTFRHAMPFKQTKSNIQRI